MSCLCFFFASFAFTEFPNWPNEEIVRFLFLLLVLWNEHFEIDEYSKEANCQIKSKKKNSFMFPNQWHLTHTYNCNMWIIAIEMEMVVAYVLYLTVDDILSTIRLLLHTSYLYVCTYIFGIFLPWNCLPWELFQEAISSNEMRPLGWILS